MNMTTKKFNVTFEVECTLELDEEVISITQEPELKNSFYDLDEDEVVEMIARCLLKGWNFEDMEGLYPLKNNSVHMSNVDWYMTDCDKE